MSSGPSSSSQITCWAVPSKAFRPDSSLLKLTRERPPKTCLTRTVSAALDRPCLLLTFTIVWAGIIPVPRAPSGPSSFSCTISRVVPLVVPQAQALTGFEKRLPCHQSGYWPVKWQAISYAPVSVLPVRLPAMKRRSRKVAPAARNSMWRGYNSRRYGPSSGNMVNSLARLPFSPVPPPTSTAAHARLAARDCSSFAILLAKFMAGSPLPASAPTDLDVHPRPFLWLWRRGAASYPPPAPCRHAAPGGSPSRPRGCLRLWLRRIAGGSSSGRKRCGGRVRTVPRIPASCRSARQWLSKCPRPRPLFPYWAAAIKPGLVVLVV